MQRGSWEQISMKEFAVWKEDRRYIDMDVWVPEGYTQRGQSLNCRW